MKTVLRKLILALSLSLIISFVFAQAGTLDSSFGVNGKATISFNNPNGEYASTVGIQKDGKIITGGSIGSFSYNSDFALARFLSNGNPDSTFGLNGKVTTHFDYFFSSSYIVKILVQPDGKIIAGGWLFVGPGAPEYFALCRYLPNGNLDSSFGVNGKSLADLPADNYFYTMALQNDGKIIAGGKSSQFAELVRYKADGSLDSSFGLNGILIENNQGSAVRDIIVQTDSKLLVSRSWTDFTNNYSLEQIVRYLSDGRIDSSFGNNGVINLALSSDFFESNSFFSIAQLNNGSIIATGSPVNENVIRSLTIAKFKPDGTADSSFGIYGRINTTLGNINPVAKQVIIDAEGKIIVAGFSNNLFFARFDTDGQIDSSYGINGIAFTDVTTNYSSWELGGLYPAVLQNDGKIIGATFYPFGVLRFKGDLPTTISLKKNISIIEGNAGTTPVQFKIVLNKPATTNVFVNYTTKNLNAITGSDYTAASGTLRIKAGKTTGNIVVNIIGDNTREANEKFALVLSSPVNAILGTFDSATCTIKNDDPSFAFNAVNSENISLKNSSVQLYPNPVKDILTIQGLDANSTSNVSITDVQGNVVAKTTTTGTHYSWNIKQLAAGTYFIKIESRSKTETIKFVKQ